MNQKILDSYRLWLEKARVDPDIVQELQDMRHDEKVLEDAFFQDLSFGTGGLRGKLGAGTNRMNAYTVAKASQGLANYVRCTENGGEQCIAVSYDSRAKSELFAHVACGVFAANGIHAVIYSELMPTPCLSYAVRSMGCCAGVMITASHNPAQYNGYKVYGPDGCQITTKAAKAIQNEINKLEIFDDVVWENFEIAKQRGAVSYILESIYASFIGEVIAQSIEKRDIDKSISIIYSPLNGTGKKPVIRALKEAGFTNVFVVPEQAEPDERFPTCPYPNPETEEAMSLGMKYAFEKDADLFLATDPDCDRVGIAVKSGNGGFVRLSGNQTGVLLLDYICSRRIARKTMPPNPVFVKTIVTTDMAAKIASKYNVRTVNVLTGFKYIGEQIGRLEKEGQGDSYILGFEESCGYLSGTYVRDKDGVNAALLICEMFAYYSAQGINLLDKLCELYNEYGYFTNTLYSYEFSGSGGLRHMQNLMDHFRKQIGQIGNEVVEEIVDYLVGVGDLPKSNVLKFVFANDSWVIIRPSGTEPKLKIYVSVCADTQEMAEYREKEIIGSLRRVMDQVE